LKADRRAWREPVLASSYRRLLIALPTLWSFLS
jgi:hypothetical protein